jgi:hypothetical protein
MATEVNNILECKWEYLREYIEGDYLHVEHYDLKNPRQMMTDIWGPKTEGGKYPYNTRHYKMGAHEIP